MIIAVQIRSVFHTISLVFKYIIDPINMLSGYLYDISFNDKRLL